MGYGPNTLAITVVEGPREREQEPEEEGRGGEEGGESFRVRGEGGGVENIFQMVKNTFFLSFLGDGGKGSLQDRENVEVCYAVLTSVEK